MSLLKHFLPKHDTIQYFCSIYFVDFGAWLIVAAKLTSLNQSGILLGKQSFLGTKVINLSISVFHYSYLKIRGYKYWIKIFMRGENKFLE